MKGILFVDYSTFQTWNYRKPEISNEIYLREVVIFERLLSKVDREGELLNIAERYHEALVSHGVDTYKRYLKLRKIDTVDEFYSYLYCFLQKYHGKTAMKRHQERYEFMQKQKKELTINQQEALLKTIARSTRDMICDIAKRIQSTNALVVTREFCEYLENKHPGGVSVFFRSHNIKSTSELVELVKCVIDHNLEVIA